MSRLTFAELTISWLTRLFSSQSQKTLHELMFERTNDFGGDSESLFVKPSESNVNLSSISLGLRVLKGITLTVP